MERGRPLRSQRDTSRIVASRRIYFFLCVTRLALPPCCNLNRWHLRIERTGFLCVRDSGSVYTCRLILSQHQSFNISNIYLQVYRCALSKKYCYNSYLPLILLIHVSAMTLVHEYWIWHHHQEAASHIWMMSDQAWNVLQQWDALLDLRCDVVFVVFGAVVLGGDYNIGRGSNRLFGVIGIGTRPGHLVDTGISSCSSTHSSSSPRLLCHWGEAVQRPLTPNQACGSQVVTALCVVLALPENRLLTLPSLPHLPFVLQEANGHKQA